jgi:hypothetical protein
LERAVALLCVVQLYAGLCQLSTANLKLFGLLSYYVGIQLGIVTHQHSSFGIAFIFFSAAGVTAVSV